MRHDPLNRTWIEHTGVDIAVGVGTSVFAPRDGRVMGIYTHAAGGKTLIIASDDGRLRFGFCHLSGYAVALGDKVRAGQQIARTGNSGRTTGAHLHYSVMSGGEWIDDRYQGGKFVNPEDYMLCGES